MGVEARYRLPEVVGSELGAGPASVAHRKWLPLGQWAMESLAQ